MKKKSNLLLVVVLMLSVNLFNSSAFAQFKCDETIYCAYKGIYNDIDGVEEEFKMLMEPSKHANFREMFASLRYVVSCSAENNKCAEMLKDHNCNVSRYAQKLISFYEANRDNIKDEFVNKLFESFKEGEGEIFFNQGKTN